MTHFNCSDNVYHIVCGNIIRNEKIAKHYNFFFVTLLSKDTGRKLFRSNLCKVTKV